MSEKILKEGPGWRVGCNPHNDPYGYLVGGDDWAVELTPAEFADFRRLSQELRQTMMAIAPELMAEERICCELESETLWMEVEGFVHAYELRFILRQGRRAEGGWGAQVLPDFWIALDNLGLF